MKIQLRVVGEGLYQRLSKEIESGNGAFPKMFREESVEWELLMEEADFTRESMVCSARSPTALIVEARDMAMVEKIQALEQQTHCHLSVRKAADTNVIVSPIIMVFQSPAILVNTDEFPDVVSDWMFTPVAISDLAMRVFCALKRKGALHTQLNFGPLTLMPDSKQITFGGRCEHLTCSELILAELFLVRLGAVVPFSELQDFFKATGKSNEANNIRVAIYQLRLKLEMLTKSQYTIVSVYKQGYCLKRNAAIAQRTTCTINALSQRGDRCLA